MPPVSEAQRRAMFAAKAGRSTLGIPQKVGAEFVKADKGGKLPQKKEAKVKSYAKGGDVKNQEDRARGGPSITERSQFMKAPDPFRTDKEQQDYPKKGPEGMEEKDKSLKPITPRI
jgi:hypothetical protein